MVYFSGAGLPRLFWKRPLNDVVVVVVVVVSYFVASIQDITAYSSDTDTCSNAV